MNIEAVMTAILSAALLSAVPLVLASTGEAIGERAGLLNLGTEGIMLVGAFSGFWVALRTESLALGLLGGAAAGCLAGALFGIGCVVIGADQVLLGLGFTLAGGGLTAFLFRELFGSSQPLLPTSAGRPFNTLAEHLPVIGPGVFGQKWFFYVAWLIVFGAELVMRHTTFGLRIRAVGESPQAVDAVGISVTRTQCFAATIAGCLAGLGGAGLSVMELGFFQPNVTLGLGFIAIALAMLGRWTPWRIAVIAIMFGLLRGLGSGLQLTRWDVSPDLLQLLPYVGVIVALILTGKGLTMPSALGQTYAQRRRRRPATGSATQE